jgi:ferritin-like protein
MDETTHQPQDLISRRSMMFKGAALGVGATAMGRLLVDPTDVLAKKGHTKVKGGRLTKGDAAILRFLAAAEIIESDLWQQYNELAGIQDGEVPGGSGNDAYTEAVEVLDEDMNQYIHDNTDDEFSHVAFINAYLEAHGERTVNLNRFRTLPSSQADGAQKNVGRLTNLMQLSVDTSFWTRYRSDTLNPDLGDTLPQAVPTLAVGQHPAIPRDNGDLKDANHLQAIANTAGFHFAFIEQGGTSLYASLAQRVTSKEVLRILLSIGGSEIMHFQTWHDKAGNAPPLTDGGLVFPDLNADGELTQTNLILPEPTPFLKRKFPAVSIIRPTETKGAAVGAARALTQDGLFIGQPREFFAVIRKLAEAADAARPGR